MVRTLYPNYSYTLCFDYLYLYYIKTASADIKEPPPNFVSKTERI